MSEKFIQLFKKMKSYYNDTGIIDGELLIYLVLIALSTDSENIKQQLIQFCTDVIVEKNNINNVINFCTNEVFYER